jgi:outer membrane protein
MKTKIFLMTVVLFLTLNVSAQKKLWTFQQCVDTALANNRNVKQQGLAKQIKAIAYDQARMNLLPNLNASANQSWNFGRSVNEYYATKNATSVGISSELTLFDGLKMKYNIDARKTEMQLSDASLEKIKQDIIKNVAASFLQILLNKELLQIANDQLVLTKSKIDLRRALVASGKLAEGEMYEILAQESKEVLNYTQAENTLKLSLLDLAQILEIDYFEDIEIVTPEYLSVSELELLSANLVYESALVNRPEIKVAGYKLQNSERNVLINKADLYPYLSIGAQSGTGYYNANGADSFNKQFSDNFKTSIGLNLRIPIFNKFEVTNRVKSAKIDVESSKLEIENAKIELKKTIQQAYFNAVAAKSRWETANKSETASREAFRFANQKYEAGRATVYELYQAKSNLTQVLSEQVQAKYEYLFRIKLLELLK